MDKLRCNWRRRLPMWAASFAVLLQALEAIGGESSTSLVTGSPLYYARTNYQSAQARFEAEPNDADIAIAAARACFEYAEYPLTKAGRAALAEEGIAACHRALRLRTNSGVAYYYLGMNLGQLARTKGWAALKMVPQLKHAFEAAATLDPAVDYGGPDRNLGYLYRDTPSFSIGDKHKAMEHLQKAVNIAPEYPENRLALIEGLLKWGERKKAREELKSLEASLPAAQERFRGPAFATNWTDWKQRVKEVQTKAHEQRKFLGIFGSDD